MTIFTCLADSGKTEWMKKLIINSDHLFSEQTRPKYFCIVYNIWQNAYDEILTEKGPDCCHFMQSLPDKEMLQKFPAPWLVMIDDQGSLALTSQFCLNLFCIYTHHLNGLAFILLQNPYMKSNPIARSISLNSSVFVFLKINRDVDMIKRISRSIFGPNWKVLYEAYIYLQKTQKYAYIIADSSSGCPSSMKVRSGIFDTELTSCFLPKNGSHL